MASAMRVDLDGKPIKPLTICMIGAGGFIGSHLCEKLVAETPHKILALDVYNDKIKHLLEGDSRPWADRIQFHRINIKHDSRLEGLIKMADLVFYSFLSRCSFFKQFVCNFFVGHCFFGDLGFWWCRRLTLRRSVLRRTTILAPSTPFTATSSTRFLWYVLLVHWSSSSSYVFSETVSFPFSCLKTTFRCFLLVFFISVAMLEDLVG